MTSKKLTAREKKDLKIKESLTAHAAASVGPVKGKPVKIHA